MSSKMREYEQQSAKDKRHKHTPFSEKAIEHSPEKELFCYGCHDATHRKEEEDITLLCRQGRLYECNGVNTEKEEDKERRKSESSKAGRPDEPLLNAWECLR